MRNFSYYFFGLLIIFSLVQPLPAQQKTAAYLRIVVGPYLQHSTQTSQAINWETNLPANSIVEYGEATPLDQSVTDSKPTTFHGIVLTNLKPQTNYFYRVISRDSSNDIAASDIFTFQTAPKQDSPFAFVVIGDSRTYPARFHRIASRIYGERPNFVIHVGDVVTDGMKKNQWIDEFLQPASILMSRVPTYVAIGNHERNAHWYYDYVAYPQPENYYSFKYGNAEFFIVDSNEDLLPESAQVKWLTQALAKSRATWKFVAHHHPPYSSDKDDYGNTAREKSTLGDLKMRKLIPLYEKYHVDIVWFGHIHSYERTYPIKDDKIDMKEGVIYIQTGGGGAELEDFAPTRSWFTAKLLSNWQYCLVTIYGDVLEMKAYDIDGRMYDFLKLQK